MMRGRFATTAVSVLTGVLWASAVSAVPVATGPGGTPSKLASSQSIVVNRGGQSFNFDLGGVALPQLGQTSLRANAAVAGIAPGVKFEFARARNWDAYGNLFPGAASLRSAQLSGSRTYAGVSLALNDRVTFSASHDVLALGALSVDQPSAFVRDLGARLGTDVRGIGMTSAKLNWTFSDWGSFGLNASRSTGNASFLGVVSGPILGATGPAQTTSLGISARVGFGEGWVTSVAYNEGVTQLDLNRKVSIATPGSFNSQSYGIAVAKEGLFGDDALGVAVSRPFEVYNGNSSLSASAARFAPMNSRVRESDVELGYVTTFLDGTLALQANAAYQLDAAGAKGQTAVTGVARAKLNF